MKIEYRDKGSNTPNMPFTLINVKMIQKLYNSRIGAYEYLVFFQDGTKTKIGIDVNVTFISIEEGD